MTISWLPIVERFCIHVTDMRYAAVVIGLYGLFTRGAVAPFPIYLQLCLNLDRNEDYGLAELILGIILLLSMYAFLFACVLVLMKTTTALPLRLTPEIFAYSVFVMVPLSFIYWIYYILVFNYYMEQQCDFVFYRQFSEMREKQCNGTSKTELTTYGPAVTLYIIMVFTLFDGLLLVYFAVVVNSFDRLLPGTGD